MKHGGTLSILYYSIKGTNRLRLCILFFNNPYEGVRRQIRESKNEKFSVIRKFVYMFMYDLCLVINRYPDQE